MSFGASRGRVAGVVGVLLCWLISHGMYAGTGDEAHYAMIAHSLAFDRDLDLSNNYGDPSNLILGGSLAPEAHALPAGDGRLRPVHDIGMPILAAPYYWLSYHAAAATERLPASWLRRARLTPTIALRHLLSLAMIALTIWIALQLADLFREVAGDSQAALLWAAVLALSPPLVAHAYLFFTETLSAALTLWIYRRLRRADVTTAAAVLAGATTGYLVLVHVRNVGLIAALAALAIYRWHATRRRELVWYLAAASIPLIVRTWLNHWLWGTWITTPHAVVGGAAPAAGWLGETAVRVLGWLVDQEHGLLFYAPIYLLAPAGWMLLRRRHRALTGEITLLVLGYVVPMTIPMINPHGWRGGWSPAARFLVPVIPLVGVLVFAYAATATRRRLVLAVLVLQLGMNLLFLMNPKVLWNDGDGTSALVELVAGANATRYLPTLAVPVTTLQMAAAAAAVAAWWVLTIWLAKVSHFRSTAIAGRLPQRS